MDEHTLQLLEYGRLLELLAGLARSEPGAEFCLGLRPDLDKTRAMHSFRLIDEAKSILNVTSSPPLDDFPDVAYILDRLGPEGVVLKPRELLQIGRAVRTSRLVRTYLKEHIERSPLLGEMAEPLPVYHDLEHTLERSLGTDGDVLDTASPELARIRREMSGLRGAIQNRLTGIMRTREAKGALQDEIITRRGGRYVIPLKSTSRGQVPGLVHDVSSSGATAFVEPLEVVEDNNRLNLAKRQERQEVERVLRRLSAMVALTVEELAPALYLLAEIDSIFARAHLSRRQKAWAPVFDNNRGVDIRDARHPLLLDREAETGRKAVPVDLRLIPEARVLVISGINAGGKTVALKTLGLLTLMAATGLHLPMAEGGSLPFFDKVLAVIGDEQNLQTDLSTFSGHVRRLSWVLDQATDRTLVVLDELGTGTDPAEGAALALAVLEELKMRGAWTITATHYHLLKSWAHLSDGAANAAVKTDVTGRPVFGLEFGSPGFSAGLAMARDMGLDPDVVERAESYLDEGQKKTIALMARLEEERAALAQAREEAEALNSRLTEALAKAAAEERLRTARHEEEVRTLREKVTQAVAKAESEFREINRRLPEAGPARGRLIKQLHQAAVRLKETVQAPPPLGPPVTELRVGDLVIVRSLGRDGTVVSVNEEKKRAEVEVSGLKVQTEWRDLARSGNKSQSGPKDQKKHLFLVNTFSAAPRELNLVGLTVDEALPMVDKTLDQALLDNIKSFSIVHGIGSGRLREAVRGYLTADERVRDFHPAARQAGGEGVTVVDICE